MDQQRQHTNEPSPSPRRMTAPAILIGAVIVLALIGVLGLLLTSPWTAPPAAVAPPWAGRASGQVRTFRLTVGRIRWELAPGKMIEAYAYNGQVPGPEIRVTEGDTVRVTVTNALTEPTTVHWHGVEVPSGMDGVPKLSQEPILPGGSFTYEFVATPAGTRWYHAHFDELAQQGDGLVGPLIIEPRAATPPAPDREYVLVTQEWATTAATMPQQPTPTVPNGGMGGMMGQGGMMESGAGQPHFDTFTVNGRAYPHTPPLLVRQGEHVRLRLINASATQTQVLGLAGHILTITHTDGNPLAKPVDAQAVLLGVGERADVEFVANHPGHWQLQGLLPGQAAQGLAIDVIYTGHEADPVQGFSPQAQVAFARYADLPGSPHPTQPDRTYDLTLSGGMMGATTWTINGQSYPRTEPLMVRPGERVRLRLSNMSMQDHPMHLHGHTFQVVAIGGRPVDGPLKDTLTVRPMEQYEIEFVANNPGVWLFHCHNLEHMSGGLMTEVRYR